MILHVGLLSYAAQEGGVCALSCHESQQRMHALRECMH